MTPLLYGIVTTGNNLAGVIDMALAGQSAENHANSAIVTDKPLSYHAHYWFLPLSGC